eukprot:scaffold256_cov261-Pinguiococcus_pyrenoidosus.AAC.45
MSLLSRAETKTHGVKSTPGTPLASFGVIGSFAIRLMPSNVATTVSDSSRVEGVERKRELPSACRQWSAPSEAWREATRGCIPVYGGSAKMAS